MEKRRDNQSIKRAKGLFAPRRARRLGWLLLPALIFYCGCSSRRTNPVDGRANASVQPATLASPSTNATPAGAERQTHTPTASQGKGQFDRYQFTYRQTGETLSVEFAPARLPWRDLTVVAAAREIIRSVYGDDSQNFPRSVVWTYEGAEVNAIKLEGNVAEYVFLPLRDEQQKESKQIRTLVCWKLAKGTVR